MASKGTSVPQSNDRSHSEQIRDYLRAHTELASKDELHAGTKVPAWYIDQIASRDDFYTSLNHNGGYVASKYVVGHRSTHDGFWRPEVDRHRRLPSQGNHQSHPQTPHIPPSVRAYLG